MEAPAEETELIARLAALTSQLRSPDSLGSVAAVSEAVGASESSIRTWFGWRTNRLSAPGARHRAAARQLLQDHLGPAAAAEAERVWAEWEAITADRAYKARAAPKGARPGRDDPARRRRLALGRQYLRGGWDPQVTPASLDASRLRLGSDVTHGELPPYVHRGIDHLLDQRIARALSASSSLASRIVGICGPPKSGKTRSLVEALKRHESSGRIRVLLLQPPPTSNGANWVASFVDALLNSDVVDYGNPVASVVLIDDLHLYCTDGEVWPELERLVADTDRVIVAFTIHDEYLQPADESRPGDPRHGLDLSAARAAAEKVPPELDLNELERAVSLIPTVDKAELRRLAERLANTPILLARAELARTAASQTANAALLYALLDLNLIEIAGSDRARIRSQQAKWWAALAPTSGPLTDRIHEASFQWATKGVGRIWALCMSTEPGRDQWRLHDGVAARLRREHAPLPSIKYDPDITVPELVRVALAYKDWAYNVSHPILEAAVHRSMGASRVPVEEAVGPNDGGRPQRVAEAIDRGHIGVITLVGEILMSNEREEAAVQHWLLASFLGDMKADLHLGANFAKNGLMQWSYDAYRRAALAGSAYANFALGSLCYQHRKFDAAQVYWERAAEKGHFPALRNLGMMLVESGDESGRELLRQAVDLGDELAAEMLDALAKIDSDLAPLTAEQSFAEAQAEVEAELRGDRPAPSATEEPPPGEPAP